MKLQPNAISSGVSAGQQRWRASGVFATVAIVLNAGTPATVYAKTMQEKTQAACADDIARLCPGTANDPDRMKPCMLKHRSDASPACMRFIDASE